MRPTLRGLGLAALILAGGASGASAGERFIGDDGYGYGYGGGYGFAGEAIGGAYIGAPFTRFPRPSELVPPAWGYGTYGVPTTTGIRQAPAGTPTVTVINGREAAPRRRSAATRLSFRDDGRWAGGQAERSENGVRVISVTVPRR